MSVSQSTPSLFPDPVASFLAKHNIRFHGHTLCKFCDKCLFSSEGSYILSMVFQTLRDAAV